MAHGHSLVHNTLPIAAVALGTLAGNTALVINTSMSGIKSPFLMKRIRFHVQLTSRTIGDDGPLVVGVANGNADTSEITTAMNVDNTIGPEDIGQTVQEDSAWVVMQNTVVGIIMAGDGTEGQLDSGWIAFGGKNGIPALEDSGVKLFIYNCGGGALATGSTINGVARLQGVWLRG